MFPLKDNIPTDRFPVVTVALIAINVVVFLFLQDPTGFLGLDGVNEAIVVHWGAIPYELTHPGSHCELVGAAAQAGQVVCEGQPGVVGEATSQPPVWVTAFTSMFMHGSLLHLFGNMLFLWIFGTNVEDSMGRARFVVFYLLGGLAALGLQIAIDTSSTVPTIGASGAVAAILGGYLRFYPHARVITVVFIIIFFTVLELPVFVMLGIWFLQQVVLGALDLTGPSDGGGGVAHFAHIGGFAFGFLAIAVFALRRKQVPPRHPVY